MNIVVASGKGGTGKTTVAVNLALSLANEGNGVQFLDCDVEEPNAHIFLKPDIHSRENVYLPVPEIDTNKCDYCGKCREVCVYNAIAVVGPSGNRKGSILTFPDLCHGCGACAYFCPKGAIKEVGNDIGVVETGNSQGMEFVQGRLRIGVAMAPPLIREVKNRLDSSRTVIIDAPPGTSCPVIEAVKKSDLCLLVTEPTPFGLNDLTLAVEVLRKLDIPFAVIVNRSGLGGSQTEEYCQRENIKVLMRIPFKKEIAVAYSQGRPVVEAFPEFKKEFQRLFAKIKI